MLKIPIVADEEAMLNDIDEYPLEIPNEDTVRCSFCQLFSTIVL